MKFTILSHAGVFTVALYLSAVPEIAFWRGGFRPVDHIL